MPEMVSTRLIPPVTSTEESQHSPYLTIVLSLLLACRFFTLSLHLKGLTKQPDVLDALFPFSMLGQPEKYCRGINPFPCDICIRREESVTVERIWCFLQTLASENQREKLLYLHS